MCEAWASMHGHLYHILSGQKFSKDHSININNRVQKCLILIFLFIVQNAMYTHKEGRKSKVIPNRHEFSHHLIHLFVHLYLGLVQCLVLITAMVNKI